MESRARGGDESLLATRLRHVHGHGRIAEVVSAVALDALAVNRWTDLGAADGERLGTLLRPPVSTAATAALDQLSRARGTAPSLVWTDGPAFRSDWHCPLIVLAAAV